MDPPPPPVSSAVYKGGRITAQEYKQYVQQCLQRLDDLDTATLALRQLHDLVDHLELNTLPIFIDCMCADVSFLTVSARSSTLRLVAVLASLYRLDLVPYLSKLVSFISRRLRDSEREVQESCAAAFGSLVRHAISPGEPMSVVLRPVFAHLQERSKEVQQSSALALTRILENVTVDRLSSPSQSSSSSATTTAAAATTGTSSELPRLAVAIYRHMTHPLAMVKPVLWQALSALVRLAKQDFVHALPAWMPLLAEAVKDQRDWTLRAAAVGFCEALLDAVYPAQVQILSPFKSDLLFLLEDLRYDKIKSVRDAATFVIDRLDTLPESSMHSRPSKWAISPSSAYEAGKSLASAMRKPKKSLFEEYSWMDGGDAGGSASGRASGGAATVTWADLRGLGASASPGTTRSPGGRSARGAGAGGLLISSRPHSAVSSTGLSSSSAGAISSASLTSLSLSTNRSDAGPGADRTNAAAEEAFPAAGGLSGLPPTHAAAGGATSAAMSRLATDLERIARQQQNLLELFESFAVSARRSLSSLEDRMVLVEQRVESVYSVQSAERTVTETGATAAVTATSTTAAGASASGGPTAAMALWTTAVGHLDNGNPEAAFSTILSSGDSSQLIRLMGRTGPVLESLSHDLAQRMMLRLAAFVEEGSFLDNVLPWLTQAASLAETTAAATGVVVLQLDRSVLQRLLETLHVLSVRPTPHGLAAAQLLPRLQRLP